MSVFQWLPLSWLFCAARDSIGSAASLWACLLMAVAEPQIQFAQEARNYMPVVTFSLTAMCSLQQLSRKPGYLAASTLTMSLVAMMLTHYFAAGVGVALGLHVMISMARGGPAACSAGICGSGFVFFAAVGPTAL